jgi:hypothetical protein
MTIVSDLFFSGLDSFAPQICLSTWALERAATTYTRPQRIYTQAAAKSASWQVANDQLSLGLDIVIIPNPLISKVGSYQRALAWTPLHALDLGIDRDISADFSGFHIPNTLMIDNDLQSLEERTAYLMQAWQVRQSLISEWNHFADLQQSLWLTILDEESILDLGQGSGVALDPGSGKQNISVVNPTPAPPAWIQEIDRASYEGTITAWLLDSGTTTRSSGAAITNDTYVEWLAYHLNRCSADLNLIPLHPIDAREVYRYQIVTLNSIGGEGADGVSGTLDRNFADPADTGQSKALDLLEELADLNGGLTAALSGGTGANIDTLPEC